MFLLKLLAQCHGMLRDAHSMAFACSSPLALETPVHSHLLSLTVERLLHAHACKMSPHLLNWRIHAVLPCICFLLLLTTSPITAASVRGAPPHLLSLYDLSLDSFRCIDGSKSMPMARVNDDYCDCLDGSDEPGLLQATQTCAIVVVHHCVTGPATKLLSVVQVHPPVAMVTSIVETGVTSHFC